MREKLNFISPTRASQLAAEHGTPIYIYSRKILTSQACKAIDFGAPYGLTVRYAMKANPHPEILKLFKSLGLEIDASSGYEADKAMQAGFEPGQISLNSQELSKNLREQVEQGVLFIATSLHQLETYAKLSPNSKVGVRINPGIGSGYHAKVNTGGVTAGFGIWHEYIPEIQAIAKKYGLVIDKLHTHIGAGTDPAVWHKVAEITIGLAKQFPSVTTISLGGGFKIGRMSDEPTADMQKIGKDVAELLTNFAAETGRKLHLEIEPGHFLTGNAGAVISEIIDITDTGKDGFTFIKLNTGMTEILRPMLYGAQHPLIVVPNVPRKNPATKQYIVIGHNCESGDLLTTRRGDPEILEPRELLEAQIGDYIVIEGCGAYCATLSAKGYNSFPVAKEIFID